ncbi:MAG: HAD-IIB family hydrolase, partial [Pisciglobus halotolerans]|nr:HAD-IIB family hydrolase [Pisciglobus halotolerans]
MLQLIVSDMDGTLLNEKMEISETNAEAIRAAERKGIPFVIATGRGYTEAKPLLEEKNIQCPLISLNGGQMFNEKGDIVKNVGLLKDSVRQMIDIIESQGLYYEMTTSKGIFSNNKAKRIETVASLLYELNADTTYKMAVALASARLEVMNINYTDDYSQLIEDETIEIIKVIVFSASGQPILNPLAKEINKLGELAITSSFENNIEINHAKAQKGIAVKEMADQLNIPLE